MPEDNPSTLQELEEERRQIALSKIEKQKRQEDYEKAVKLKIQSTHHIASDKAGKTSADYFRIKIQDESLPRLEKSNSNEVPENIDNVVIERKRNSDGILIDDEGNTIDERTGEPLKKNDNKS